MRTSSMIAAVVAAGLGSSAFGAYNITQSSAQDNAGLANSITFDEPGTPAWDDFPDFPPANPDALNNPQNHYLASHGVSFGFGDATFLAIADWDAIYGVNGGVSTGNSINGQFSVRSLFTGDITEMDFQGWSDGAPGPPSGGAIVILLNDDVVVGSADFTAAFGTSTNSWYHIEATDGDAFDEVRYFNGSFQTRNNVVDNISFSTIPAPSALALFGLVGLAGRRRRG